LAVCRNFDVIVRRAVADQQALFLWGFNVVVEEASLHAIVLLIACAARALCDDSRETTGNKVPRHYGVQRVIVRRHASNANATD